MACFHEFEHVEVLRNGNVDSSSPPYAVVACFYEFERVEVLCYGDLLIVLLLYML